MHASSAVVVFMFLAGLWFTEAIINGPNFHPTLTLGHDTSRIGTPIVDFF